MPYVPTQSATTMIANGVSDEVRELTPSRLFIPKKLWKIKVSKRGQIKPNAANMEGRSMLCKHSR